MVCLRTRPGRGPGDVGRRRACGGRAAPAHHAERRRTARSRRAGYLGRHRGGLPLAGAPRARPLPACGARPAVAGVRPLPDGGRVRTALRAAGARDRGDGALSAPRRPGGDRDLAVAGVAHRRRSGGRGRAGARHGAGRSVRPRPPPDDGRGRTAAAGRAQRAGAGGRIGRRAAAARRRGDARDAVRHAVRRRRDRQRVRLRSSVRHRPAWGGRPSFDHRHRHRLRLRPGGRRGLLARAGHRARRRPDRADHGDRRPGADGTGRQRHPRDHPRRRVDGGDGTAGAGARLRRDRRDEHHLPAHLRPHRQRQPRRGDDDQLGAV